MPRRVRIACNLLLALLFTVEAAAKEASADNAALLALFKSDQDERNAQPRAAWPEIQKHDVQRAQSVLELLKQGQLRSAADYCRAGLIFHHGQDLDQVKMAYSLAWIGYQLDSTNRQCALLTAQAWDRIMVRQGKLQWYGTQYAQRDEKSGLTAPLPVDKDAISNKERERFGVDPLP